MALTNFSISLLAPSRQTLLCLRTMSSASLLKSQAYVDGKWVGAKSGKTYDVKNPVNGKVITSVPNMDATDTKAAIDAAHKVNFVVPRCHKNQ